MGDNIFADHSNEANNHRNDDVLEGGLRVPESEVRNENTLSPRRIRNQSYYRAVSNPDTTGSSGRRLAVRKRQDDPSTRKRALLYQHLTEKALGDGMEEEDESMTNGKSSGEEADNFDGLSLWSNLPGVRNSGILATILPKDKKRQEAMYELYTSEQSYLRSLNVLVDVFYSSEELKNTTSTTDRHHLFSNLNEIKVCSEEFLRDLENRYCSCSDAVKDVCDVVHSHISKGNFNPYITYCANEVFQQRAFQRLSTENSEFAAALKNVENSPSIMGLPLHSFLLLPMQRVTRFPLLVDMICQKCEPGTAAHSSALLALKDTKRLVKDCNDRAKSLQRMEDMITLQGQLDFKTRDRERVMLRFQTDTPSSCARWVTSLRSAIQKEEPICPSCVQVRIVRPFRSSEPDLITLQPADTLFVMQSTSDGWYYGERLVDRTRGWFPSSHAKEVLNQKTRENNYRKGTRMYVIETEL